ncbi:DNA-protecting protein DprA [Mesorhizobium sp. M0959]|uniref:DNA-processing protein DprA n=1 Tax=Mesorhizobium sp. M0959 TaxID=2957034 RepID=UPI00333707E1
MLDRAEKSDSMGSKASRYRAPQQSRTVTLQFLLQKFNRTTGSDKQLDLLRTYGAKDVFIHYAGDIDLLSKLAVSIVGTRDISEMGIKRARKLAQELADAGVLVMSGLAKGVDTVAHTAAISAGGATAAVIGTPINKSYPAENARLQEEIYSDHLLLSPFEEGSVVFRANFPKRNRVMALLSDATVIVEASDTSGTLHQAAECQRNGRWLFIMKSVAEDPNLTWPGKFLNHPKTKVLASTRDLLDALRR